MLVPLGIVLREEWRQAKVAQRQYNGLVEFSGLVLALSVQFPLSVVLLSVQGFRIAQVRN
jgi:hypothetical protein